MGKVLGDVLGFAAAVAVSPLPITAIILLLATPRGRLNGLLFTAGWVVGLAGVAGVTLAVAGPAGSSGHGHTATWVGVLKLALGGLLVLFGARQWHRRPKDPAQARLPKWMSVIDSLSPGKTLGLGLALAAANAKNAPLAIAVGPRSARPGFRSGSRSRRWRCSWSSARSDC